MSDGSRFRNPRDDVLAGALYTPALDVALWAAPQVLGKTGSANWVRSGLFVQSGRSAVRVPLWSADLRVALGI